MFGFCGNQCAEPAATWSRSSRSTAPGPARTRGVMLMNFWSCEVQKPQHIYSAVAKMKDLFCICLDLCNLAHLVKDPESLLVFAVEGFLWQWRVEWSHRWQLQPHSILAFQWWSCWIYSYRCVRKKKFRSLLMQFYSVVMLQNNDLIWGCFKRALGKQLAFFPECYCVNLQRWPSILKLSYFGQGGGEGYFLKFLL